MPDEDLASPAADAAVEDMTPEQLWAAAAAADRRDDDLPEQDVAAVDSFVQQTDSSEDEGTVVATQDDPDAPDPAVLKAQNDRLKHSLDSAQGRLAAKTREIERLQRQVAEAEKSAPRDQRDVNLQKDRREKLEKARQEYGDVVGPVLDHVTELERRLDQLTAREQTDLQAKRGQLDSLLEVEMERLETEHPDGLKVIEENGPTFLRWIDDQPAAVRALYNRNAQQIVDGTETAYLVGLFKQALLGANGSPAKADPPDPRLSSRRQSQLAGARVARGSPSTGTTSAPDPRSPDMQAHWEHYARIEREQERAARR